MWPWAHLSVGYLIYTVFSRLRYRRPPDERGTVALGVGTLLPDIIDKPLAWTLEILPHGRSLGHSLFTTFVIIVAVGLFFRRQRNSTVTTAFGIGYLSHLLGDGGEAIIESGFSSLGFLLWPVIPAAGYRITPSFTSHIRDIEFTVLFALQFGFTALVMLIWWYDRKPGLTTAKRIPRLVVDSLAR